jgi:hypothetical protein
MSTFRPTMTPRSSHPTPTSMQGDVDRHTWLDFAGVLLILVGFFNIIDGISAISGSSYVSDHVVFSNLNTWGWFFLIVGIVQILAGGAVMKGAGWAALVGIVTAGVNLLSQLSASHTFAFWAVTIAAIDVLVIYGLVMYGGERGRAR